MGLQSPRTFLNAKDVPGEPDHPCKATRPNTLGNKELSVNPFAGRPALTEQGVRKLPRQGQSISIQADVATVLIFAREEVVAALLGLLVELSGYQPAFAHNGETPAAACARLGCSKLIVDCDNWECSDKALGALQQTAVKIVLFSPSRLPSDKIRTMDALGIRAFTLPIGP